MPALASVIRSLIARPGKSAAVRLQRGLALRYTPPDKEHSSKAATLSLSRRDVPPSAAEVQAVVKALATALNRPGGEFLVTEAGQVRRVWFTEPELCPEHEEPLPCSACATLLIMAS